MSKISDVYHQKNLGVSNVFIICFGGTQNPCGIPLVTEKEMAKIIRKYLVVLLTDSPICHGVRGIEFSPAGREVFTDFVTQEPGFTIKWNNKIFLKRGTHTTRKLVEENSIWLTTVIVRYVEVSCTDLNSILEEKPKTRH